MISTFLIWMIFSVEPDYVKFNENSVEITVYVNDVNYDENLFKNFLERKSCVELVNPKAMKSLDQEKVENYCKQIDNRLAGIRQNFSFKIKDRHLIRAPYGLGFGSQKIKEFPTNLHLEHSLCLLEYYIDTIYYDKEIEKRKKNYEWSYYDYHTKDLIRRSEFIKTLDPAKIRIENPPYFFGECNYPLYVIVYDGQIKTIEELGYEPEPLLIFKAREKYQSPIGILKSDVIKVLSESGVFFSIYF